MIKPTEINKIVKFLENNGCSVFFTGSYALGCNKEDSDLDIFVLTETKDKAYDILNLYDSRISPIVAGGSIDPTPLEDVDTMSFYSHDKEVNLILSWNKEVAERWKTATKLSIAFQCESKPHRVACFTMLKAGVRKKPEEALLPF